MANTNKKAYKKKMVIGVQLVDDELDRFLSFQKRNHLRTKSETLRLLVMRQLEACEKVQAA